MFKYGIKYFSFCIILIYSCIFTTPAIYAESSNHGKIREVSSKKNEALFNKIAIDLVNGKSRYVSLDNMVMILKNYDVVEFSSEGIEPARDIILKEIAFRMLKQHYLPRIGDKIKVAKLENEFLSDTGIHYRGSQATIKLPLEVANVRDRDELRTLYWTDLVMQITTAIERLWFNRIRYLEADFATVPDAGSLLEAAFLLRKKFIQQGETEGALPSRDPAANAIARASEELLRTWRSKGLIVDQDVPALADMIIQYIILSGSMGSLDIAGELKELEDIDSFKEALFLKIKAATEVIKNYNPADYGAFAMLQSMLNDISAYPLRIPATRANQPQNVTPDSQKTRHSA